MNAMQRQMAFRYHASVFYRWRYAGAVPERLLIAPVIPPATVILLDAITQAMPEATVVHGEIARLGLDAELGGIVVVRHEVALAKTHRPEALRVAAGNEPQPAVLAPAAIEMETDVQHALRHAAVE